VGFQRKSNCQSRGKLMMTFTQLIDFHSIMFATRLRVRVSKVIHKGKNLFCYLRAICNLVSEFNGLVSIKGQRKLALFTFYGSKPVAPFFLRCFPTLPRCFSARVLDP